MTATSATPLDERNEARTPPSLFKKLDERFHFDCDIAATEDNALCVRWYKDFLHPEAYLLSNDVAFGNPPYSRGMIDKFCKKAYEESLKGAVVVMLLPADTSTKYFHKYCMQASEIIFITSRVHFNRPDGTPFKTSPKFGSMVVVFKNELFDGSPVISSMGWK